jgi:hypothetical protein
MAPRLSGFGMTKKGILHHKLESRKILEEFSTKQLLQQAAQKKYRTF